jgi:hypothetical protein
VEETVEGLGISGVESYGSAATDLMLKTILGENLLKRG